jgi:hypothetical protein
MEMMDESVAKKVSGENVVDNKGSELPSKSELLSRFHPGQVFYLRGGFLKVRKKTNKDVVLRPLTKSEVKRIMEDLEKQRERSKEDVGKIKVETGRKALR